jgi:hypothetical protein
VPLSAVYDMTLGEFLKYLEGISERHDLKRKDEERQAVLIGAYTGHYVNSRRPTSPKEFIDAIYEEKKNITVEEADEIIDRANRLMEEIENGGRDKE